MNKISGAEFPVKKVFSNSFAFEIPAYQRPYAWTTDEAGEMLDDFISFMKQSNAEGGEEPYFLGSIVLIKEENNPHAEVIDGQQRLTTLTILLAVIAKGLDSENATALMRYINEPGNPIEKLEPRPRLTLRERDREFFRRYIQTEGALTELEQVNPDTDSRENIRANALLFIERLRSWSPEEQFRLGQFIANQCYLVVVSTPSLQSAYRIFSVMNDRGLDLLPSDILKADIIGAMPEQDRDSYSKRWEDVEEMLGREGLSDLLAHARMIYRPAKQQRTLLDEMREYVLPEFKPPQHFIDKVLEPFADAFEVLRNAAYERTSGAEGVNRALSWLLKIDNVDWMPPAIAFYIRHTTDPEFLTQFLNALERLAASMFIRRSGVNERIDRYAKLIERVKSGVDVFADESPLMLTPEERRQTLAALDGDIYSVARTRSFILQRLDSMLADAGALYDHSVITVEHVLPQTIRENSQWATWWPDPEQREAWVHRLGNLLLLSRRKNSSAQNYGFDVKKKRYFSGASGVSTFAITTDVLREEEWTPAIVTARQSRLLQVLQEGWNL